MRDPYSERGEVVSRWVKDRQSLLRREAEDYLRRVIVDGYEARRGRHWHRQYSSIEAFTV